MSDIIHLVDGMGYLLKTECGKDVSMVGRPGTVSSVTYAKSQVTCERCLKSLTENRYSRDIYAIGERLINLSGNMKSKNFPISNKSLLRTLDEVIDTLKHIKKEIKNDYS